MKVILLQLCEKLYPAEKIRRGSDREELKRPEAPEEQ